MNKSVVTVTVLVVIVMLSACNNKSGKITSRSRYVTPAMIQQIQKKVDEMPEEKDTKANEILKADVLSAFKRDGMPETAEDKSQENIETQIAEEPDAVGNDTEKHEEVQQTEKPALEETKELKQNNKIKIDDVSESETVYVSGNGKKFHKTADCSGMKSAVAMTRTEAENSGRTYCKKCYE